MDMGLCMLLLLPAITPPFATLFHGFWHLYPYILSENVFTLVPKCTTGTPQRACIKDLAIECKTGLLKCTEHT